jgi:hypothetical protein
MLLLGIFNKSLNLWLGFTPRSEIFTAPNLKRSARMIEKIGRWSIITIGVSFLVQGLGGILPDGLIYPISLALFGLAGILLIAILAITITNWKAR